MIKQRIVTAAILALLLLGAIVLLPKSAVVLLLAGLFLGGFWEWAGFVGHPFGLKRAPFVALGAAALIATYVYIFRYGGSALAILLPAAVWWLIALIWIIRYPTPVPRSVVRAAAFVVLIPAWLGLSLLLTRPQSGALWMLAAFVLIFAADTGAYFSGKAFGKHKLAPAVSPGKTLEGVLGGAVLSCAIAFLFAPYLGVSSWLLAAVTLPIALVSVVGDLIVSLFKRNAGLKDSGRLFPGHGGILDRIDSVCAAAPMLALGLLVTDLGQI
ncbi:MAG: phosphatidate cytidylyltransferase [Gammaproteobacteria bacterium]